MHDNDNKQLTPIAFGLPSADLDFLAMLQKFIALEAERRQRIVPFWLALRIDGVHRCVIDSQSWCRLDFDGGTCKVEIVGRDAEGEVVIATYLPTYDGPKTEAWKVSLPWGDEVSCTFEYGFEECVRVVAKRMVKPKLVEMHQLARAPLQNFFGFDSAYVERLRAGDPLVAQQFFAYFEEFLNAKLSARGVPSDRVEDLQQETFIRVITALRRGEEIREPQRFGALVNSVCDKVVVEYNQARAKNYPRPLQKLALEEPHVGAPDRVPDPEVALVSKQSAVQMRQILDAMPTRDRDLLRAILFEKRDIGSLCREFGVRREYLRFLLHRANVKFRLLQASLSESEERKGRDEKSTQDRGQDPAHSSRDKI